RRARWHRRAYAEGPCLIARRGDDASPRGIADRDWAASQGWIIALLDRRVEGVHVDVDDLACVGFAHGKSHINGIQGRKDGLCRSELSLSTAKCAANPSNFQHDPSRHSSPNVRQFLFVIEG